MQESGGKIQNNVSVFLHISAAELDALSWVWHQILSMAEEETTGATACLAILVSAFNVVGIISKYFNELFVLVVDICKKKLRIFTPTKQLKLSTHLSDLKDIYND